VPGVYTQTTYEAWRQIAWTSDVCRMFGPFVMISDRESTSAQGFGYTPRTIRIRAVISAAAAASVAFYFALMPGTANPWNGGAHMFRVLGNGATTGVQTLEQDLVMERSNDLITSPWVSREGGSAVATVDTAAYSVWVGWYMTDAADALYSLTGYELR
jgi:hypothetical protein